MLRPLPGFLDKILKNESREDARTPSHHCRHMAVRQNNVVVLPILKTGVKGGVKGPACVPNLAIVDSGLYTGPARQG